MTRIDELALKCGVSRSTVMNVAKRIHEIEGGGKVWRYPTEEEINNIHAWDNVTDNGTLTKNEEPTPF